MRILLWHVHGAWTTAFVHGEHEYTVPVVPDRGPDGVGIARTYSWPVGVRELSPDELRDEEFDVVVLQRPHELEHLAAAVGTPVVSLYAPTVPAVRWRPWGVEHRLLHTRVSCAGCRARECPVAGHPCVDGVTPADVLEALDRLAPRTVEVAA